MRTTRLSSGETIPVLGQGTWRLGDSRASRAQEIAALQLGIDLGLTLIDTAEMYGDGASERLVAEAIAGRRERVFLVTKVLPGNARSRRRIVASCERSLRNLGTDRIDLYLLHWRHGENLEAVVATFEELVKAGKIRHWGVSNCDISDLEAVASEPEGHRMACDQVLYNCSRRGIEYDLLRWAQRREINVMAYTPIEQGRILGEEALRTVAARHGATPAQIALAWVLRQQGVVAIPRARSSEHVRENAGSLDILLSPRDLADIDRAFPPPTAPRPLEML